MESNHTPIVIPFDNGMGALRFIAEGDVYTMGGVEKRYNRQKIQFAITGSKDGWREVPQGLIDALSMAMQSVEVKAHMGYK